MKSEEVKKQRVGEGRVNRSKKCKHRMEIFRGWTTGLLPFQAKFISLYVGFNTTSV